MGNEKSIETKELKPGINLSQKESKEIGKILNSYTNKSTGEKPLNSNQCQKPMISKQSLGRSATQTFSKPKPHTITSQMLRSCFKSFAIDGQYLNKDRFNDAIETLFKFPGFPEMHYTYLSEKIYNILDDSGDGKIQEEEFCAGLSEVLKDREFRMRLCMLAMMSMPDKNRNYIEVREIKDFFFKSWVYGYKHLGWQINRVKAEFLSQTGFCPTTQQLGEWAARYEKQIKFAIDNDLKESGVDVLGQVDFITFKNWLKKDHTLYLQIGPKYIAIATSLVKLDDVGFEDKIDLGPIFGPGNVNKNTNNYQFMEPGKEVFDYGVLSKKIS